MADRPMSFVVLVALVCGFVGGLIGGVVAPLLIAGAVLGGEAVAEKSFVEKAKDSMAGISAIGVSTEIYLSEHGVYPTVTGIENAAPLFEPIYGTTLPRMDGWGQMFLYTSTDQEYVITSIGPDNDPGTSDDIIYSNGSFVQYPF